MSATRLQDTRSIDKNQLNFYTLAMKNWNIKLKAIQFAIASNE